MGFGLGGRSSELEVARLVDLFVGPVEGSVGSFGRCSVSSSTRIMLIGLLQVGGGREEEIVDLLLALRLV